VDDEICEPIDACRCEERFEAARGGDIGGGLSVLAGCEDFL